MTTGADHDEGHALAARGSRARGTGRVGTGLIRAGGPSRLVAHPAGLDYLGLLAEDIDDAAVIRRCNGELVEINQHERLEVVRRLHAARTSNRDIAQFARLHERQVCRDLHVLGLTANVPDTIPDLSTRGKRR